MRNRPLAIAFALLVFVSACTKRPAVQVTITPEEKFALSKLAASAASDGLAVRISVLEQNPEPNARKIRVLKLSKGILDEYNAQVKDVATLDLSSREKIRAALDKGLAGADNLLAAEVITVEDPVLQAELRAIISIARNAIASFGVLFPSPPQTVP